MNKKIVGILLCCLMALSTMPVIAWQKLNQYIDIECVQNSALTRINCDYRLPTAHAQPDVEAILNGQSLPLLNNDTWPWANARTAVLFLIDTSDPARENVVRQNIAHVEQLLGSLPEQTITGLATFDKDLEMIAPLGSSDSELLTATSGVHAIGKTTELYRNLINAIEAMSHIQADRKLIFLFSDGLAEDKAYFHSDVINSARENNIVVNSLGYPRSVSLSVALQVIRRISEETGGQYVEVNKDMKLPQSFVDDPLQVIDNGGRFTVDLENISYDNIPETTGLTLRFDTGSSKVTVTLPMQRPAVPETVETVQPIATPVAVPVEQQPAVTSTDQKPRPAQETVTVVQQAPAKSSLDKWFLYGIPIALVVLLLLTIATLIITFIKPRERSLPQVQLGDLKPYAYLITQDESQRRYPITRTTWRIGRSKDNELSLDDNSISRRHAEIHRSQGDEFTIIDLDSLNGVFINNEKVKIQQLKEGDMVEIGDINFRFTLHGADQPLEDTVMQKTKTPMYTH